MKSKCFLNKWNNFYSFIFFFELVLIAIVFSLIFFPFINNVFANVGDEVVVITELTVGNVFPQIINVTIFDDEGFFDLVANETTPLVVSVIVRDYNGDETIDNVTGELFHLINSSYGGPADNLYNYKNESCFLNTSYGNEFELEAICTFFVEYYALPGEWNMTFVATDNTSLSDSENASTYVNDLLALGLPEVINFGTVNATEVSEEQIANVTNFGNVVLNLSLSGYAVEPGDGNAMNCTLGDLKNISIDYEKYNLTAPTLEAIDFFNFDDYYTNLTSSPITREFRLSSREDNTAPYIDDTSPTFWRIYVPLGVAGSCQGNIVFGATQGPED